MPHCGKSAARELDVPFLGAIPLDMEIGRLGDIGQTFTKNETPAAKAFDKVVDAILVQRYGNEAPSPHQNL